MADPLLDDLPKYEHDEKFWARARAAISEGFCPDGHRLEPAGAAIPDWAAGGFCPGHHRMHWARVRG